MIDSDKRTAVLVDQHPLWLDTVEQLLARAGVSVVAKMTSSAEAQAQLATLAPSLLITGLRMAEHDIDAYALIRTARERVSQVKVIALSMYDDPEHIDAAFAAGADAYVLKTAQPEDLLSAIRQAFDHSVYFAGSRPVAAPAPAAPADTSGLTRRELEILRLVADGHSNAQLARMLWVTEQTVKFHLSNIYRKLGVANRTEASRWAQLKGLLGANSQPAAAADVVIDARMLQAVGT